MCKKTGTGTIYSISGHGVREREENRVVSKHN